MHPRYEAPIASGLWSPQARAGRLRYISDQYTLDAINQQLIEPLDVHRKIELCELVQRAGNVRIGDWKSYEMDLGHEIVGFLQAYLDRLPAEVHPYVHYGLTSSDLVEYEMHRAMSNHAERLSDEIRRLSFVLRTKSTKYDGLERAGRTHGQTAEVTTLSHQLNLYHDSFLLLVGRMLVYRNRHLTKTPGPVGHSPLRKPILDWVPSTQIIPRDVLMDWANDYLRLAGMLESLAMFVRLGSRSEIGEFREGLGRFRQGSSAMPGKQNPIDSEKVCGLARIARGYHLALSEVQGVMWEERDLSNSSTERIAVPGLAATVEHMVATMLQVMSNLEVDGARIGQNAQHPATRANMVQNEIQKTEKVGPIEASRIARKEQQ